MFLACLHAVGWNCPNCLFEVQFSPNRSDHFASAGCGQDREFQSESGIGLPFAQVSDESGQRLIGERLMVAA